MPNTMRGFVLSWNFTNPIDLWWRRKHKVPFNSLEHRSTSMLDMYFEFIEDNLEYIEINYEPGNGDFLISRELTESDLDKEFEKMDVDNIPNPENDD